MDSQKNRDRLKRVIANLFGILAVLAALTCLLVITFSEKIFVHDATGVIQEIHLQTFSGREYYMITLLKDDGSTEVVQNRNSYIWNKGDMRDISFMESRLDEFKREGKRITLTISGISLPSFSIYGNVVQVVTTQ